MTAIWIVLTLAIATQLVIDILLFISFDELSKHNSKIIGLDHEILDLSEKINKENGEIIEVAKELIGKEYSLIRKEYNNDTNLE